ncbi:hypothetical protein SKUN_00875 [Spiroplasma kunkelii CR2-3x]|uniref:Spiroplasmavirus-related protein n=2 Tax=Spiroplasma kunkelii TaxID=47834 RepID=A0A0K2JGR4_SPIKU|nr:hypothetical protein SKUN_00875 [Spiroplasma kunkelii CR2-3x]
MIPFRYSHLKCDNLDCNNLPGMKEIYKFVNEIVHVFSNVSELFNNISNLFAFDITFNIMLSSILVLAMVNGLLM